MKSFILLLTVIFSYTIMHAQNVGIGTTNPNNSAALDIRSTTKGLLIPSMTTLQRNAIASPPNGLMVYDTDKNEYYHYNSVNWRPILNGDYWTRTITTRDRISNTTDSVGIGTSLASERLDVNGNIRSRNNILVDNDILVDHDVSATGNIIGGNLVTTGNILGSGVATLSGDITTSSDLIVNNTTATLQLKSSNVNKGFFQLSGNNVRMGTNSGNGGGNLIIRMDGNDRIHINPQGDMNLEGRVTRGAITGNANLLPVCMGQIDETGAIINGTGNFTVTKDGTGQYTFTCSQVNSTSILMVSPCFGVSMLIQYLSGNKFFVWSYDPVNVIYRDTDFYFIVYNINL